MAVLAAATQAGATKLTLGGVTSPATYFVVGKGLLNAELHRAVSVVGRTITLEKPLESDMPAKCIVKPFDGGLIPWSWWGGKPKGTQTDATANTLAFNRLSQAIYKTNGAGGIRVDVGNFWVNGELRPERDQTIEGVSPSIACAISAAPDFPFDDTGNVAIIHPIRDGKPVLYSATGPSGRWYMRNIYVNAGKLPNSNGIITSPQQPDHMESVRIDNCAGLYGLCLTDIQDVKVTNLVLIHNACSLRCVNGVILARFYGLNIEQNTGPVMCELEMAWSSFYGVHLESGSEEVAFNCTGGATGLGFSDVFYSNAQTGTCFKFDAPQANPGGASRYVLENVWCNTPSNAYKMVDDIQRGKSLNSFSDTDRWIDYLTPRVLVNGYTKTP